MTVNLRVENFGRDLEDFKISLQRVDMDAVKRLTARKSAEDLLDMVVQMIKLEEDIDSPNHGGPWEPGKGPSMGTERGWIVKRQGRSNFEVVPHPQVKQRAIVLNYGYPGQITPDGDNPMQFKLNGTPIIKNSVPGPDATNYWETAVERFRSHDQLARNGELALQNEMEKHF